MAVVSGSGLGKACKRSRDLRFTIKVDRGMLKSYKPSDINFGSIFHASSFVPLVYN